MSKNELLVFGENLRRFRIKLGLSQVKLAREIGIHPVYLNGVERGDKNISLLNIHKIARALNIPVTLLLHEVTSRYTGVIFDLHFTLIHFSPPRGLLYQRICREYGIEVSPTEIEAAFTAGWYDYSNEELAIEFSKHTNERKMESWWLKFHQKMFQRLEITDIRAINKIHQEISQQIYNNPKIYKIYPDTLRILPFLREQGIKLGLITNAHKAIKKVIEALSLAQYFDYTAISCVLGISKPDPKIFTLTAKKIGLPTKEILFVGDSFHTDVLGAQKAGCDIAIIDRRNSPSKKMYDATYINNLMQLKNLVRY